MLEALATKADVEYVAGYLQKNLYQTAVKLSDEKSPLHRRKVWTMAIWQCFDDLRSSHTNDGLKLYPKGRPTGGRAKGEFLTDFMLINDEFGPIVACESELGNVRDIAWAFDKLRAVKAGIKILIFEFEHTQSGELPEQIRDIMSEYLSCFAYFDSEAEFYLLLQLDKEAIRAFTWTPPSRGPFPPKPDTIVFQLLN